MTTQEFLEAFAAQIGVAAPTTQEFDALLEVASLAAHSPERLAAPLACWMGGASELSAAEPRVAARRVAAPDAA